MDSVRCMDVVSSTAIGVDCGWMVDGRAALPAIDGRLLGSCVDPATMLSLCVVEWMQGYVMGNL